MIQLVFFYFYSIFTIGKPCLVLLHGNVYPNGTMWEHILPAATRLVRVHKEPQREINGNKIEHIQNQADIGRIEILIGVLLCTIVLAHYIFV